MVKINELADFLIVAKDKYKENYRRAKQEREQSIKELNRDFNKNTPRYNQEKAIIEQTFKDEIAKAKKQAEDFIYPLFEELQESELKRVEEVKNLEDVQKLLAISDLPITSLELRTLAKKYCGRGYYSDKILLQIAEKNGIPARGIETIGLQPSIDTKLYVLEELRSQFEQILSQYKGKPDYHVEVLLSDNVVYRAEKMFSNGYSEGNFDDEQIAKRALAHIKAQPNEMEKGIAIKNIMENANETVKAELLASLASGQGNNIGQFALATGGVADAVEAYRGGLASEYHKAKNIMSVILDCGDDSVKMADIISDHTENKMLLKMIEDKCIGNDALNDAAEIVNNNAKVQLINAVVDLDRENSTDIVTA